MPTKSNNRRREAAERLLLKLRGKNPELAALLEKRLRDGFPDDPPPPDNDQPATYKDYVEAIQWDSADIIDKCQFTAGPYVLDILMDAEIINGIAMNDLPRYHPDEPPPR